MQTRVERQEEGQGQRAGSGAARQRGGKAADVPGMIQKEKRGRSEDLPRCPAARCPAYCTAFIMSKIGRYIATTMPPTMTPRTTIIRGSMSESRAETATSTSSS